MVLSFFFSQTLVQIITVKDSVPTRCVRPTVYLLCVCAILIVLRIKEIPYVVLTVGHTRTSVKWKSLRVKRELIFQFYTRGNVVGNWAMNRPLYSYEFKDRQIDYSKINQTCRPGFRSFSKRLKIGMYIIFHFMTNLVMIISSS